MRKESNHLNEQSRLDMRAKRRKTNKVLNTAIALVLLLIIFVSIKIFFSNDDEKASENKTETVSSTVKTETENKSSHTDNSKEESKDKNTADKNSTNEEKNSEDVTSEDIEDQQIVTDGGSNSEVKKTVVNPSWKPIKSSQTTGPAQNYDASGVDWAEMVQAITYATGFDEGNGDILKRLENNGPKKSVGTIVKKDSQQIYRVYLEWVDNEGWKPVLVEELSELPSYLNQ